MTTARKQTLAGLLCGLVLAGLLFVGGCQSGKQAGQQRPPTPAPQGLEARDGEIADAADRIASNNAAAPDSPQKPLIAADVAVIEQALAKLPAAEIAKAIASIAAERDAAIKENAKLAAALAAERENFAKSVRKWCVVGLYLAAVVCAGLAVLRVKAALSTGLAPLAALKTAAFLGGAAASCISLAKIVGAWWVEYAAYAVAGLVVGWLGYTLWREQRLEQAQRAAKAVVKRLDAAYESSVEADKQALDAAIFDPLSADMKAIAGAKSAIHLLRADKNA